MADGFYMLPVPALAVALGNLYHEEVEVEQQDLCGVLAAANVLGFVHLING